VIFSDNYFFRRFSIVQRDNQQTKESKSHSP
jgi:hypothetical protein